MGLNITKESENFSLCTVGKPYLTRAEGERLWGPCPNVVFHEEVEEIVSGFISQEGSGRYPSTYEVVRKDFGNLCNYVGSLLGR